MTNLLFPLNTPSHIQEQYLLNIHLPAIWLWQQQLYTFVTWDPTTWLTANKDIMASLSSGLFRFSQSDTINLPGIRFSLHLVQGKDEQNFRGKFLKFQVSNLPWQKLWEGHRIRVSTDSAHNQSQHGCTVALHTSTPQSQLSVKGGGGREIAMPSRLRNSMYSVLISRFFPPYFDPALKLVSSFWPNSTASCSSAILRVDQVNNGGFKKYKNSHALYSKWTKKY